MLTLLALVVTALSVGTRDQARIARNLVEAAKARNAAEGAIHISAWRLVQPQENGTWQGDGTVHDLAIDGMPVRVIAFDEAGKIDLNTAQLPMLHGLLAAVGLDGLHRSRLVDAILDWRDRDSLRRLHGVEDQDYEIAGYDYGAKDAPFDTIDELELLLGMDPATVDAIRGSVTVYSGRAGVNPVVAPLQVLMAIPGMDARTAAAYLEQRRRHQLDGLVPPQPPVGDRTHLSPARGTTYSIHAEAHVAGTAISRVSAIIRLRRGSNEVPFDVLEWRFADARAFRAAAPAATADGR